MTHRHNVPPRTQSLKVPRRPLAPPQAVFLSGLLLCGLGSVYEAFICPAAPVPMATRRHTKPW